MSEKEKVVGIDLGTTNSCIAIVRGGRPEVLLNSEGERITPSAVAFMENGEILVGQLAKRQAIINPTRTVLSVKRRMGTDWRFRVEMAGQVKEFTPEQISAFILQKLKRDAEELLGTKIQKAVITCPAYFNSSMAARIAPALSPAIFSRRFLMASSILRRFSGSILSPSSPRDFSTA